MREWNFVNDHKATRISNHINALPQRHRSYKNRITFATETLDQSAQRVLALEHDVLHPVSPKLLSARACTFPRGKKHKSSAATSAYEATHVFQRFNAGAFWTRSSKRSGNIEDSLFGRIERRAYVDPLPWQRRHHDPRLVGERFEAFSQAQGC